MEVISPMTWESFKYTVVHGETEKEKSGEFTQFPLRLAYGITIHRSQGQTFDKSMISFQGGVFAAGQAYVALSRCRTLEGIYLLHPVKKEHFIVDKNVVAFMEEIRSGKYAMS